MSMQRRQLVKGLAFGMALPPWQLVGGQTTTPLTGSQHIDYEFAPTQERMPLRYYVPTSWDGTRAPLGHTPLGAYGNPLRLPAVFGQDEVAALPGALACARADVRSLC